MQASQAFAELFGAVFLQFHRRGSKRSTWTPQGWAVLQHLEMQGIHAQSAPTNADLLTKLVASTKSVKEPQIVVFFTNGSFDGIIPRYAAAAGV